MVLQQTDDYEPKSYWQPELTSGATEIGPLPKTLSLPYLDDLKLVADNKKVAVKKVSKLKEELRFYKFIGTVLMWLSIFFLVTFYLWYSFLDRSFLSDAGVAIVKFSIPLILISFLIRQSCIWLDKKYVKKPNFSAVVFNRKAQTITIKYGWKRKKLTAPFDYVHAYIRYLSTPTGLKQPKLMLKIFDEQAPHNVRMNYFLDIGPAQTEYQFVAQWSVLCHFMDTECDYPYNPHFWDAGVSDNFPEDYKNYLAGGKEGEASEESQHYYNNRLMDYALDQNAMGMIGAEQDAGIMGVFAADNPDRRTFTDMENRQADIAEQVAYLEDLFGTSFAVPPPGIWFSQKG